MLVDVFDWVVDCDVDATRAAYALIPSGDPDRCTCDDCENYVAARDHAYPAEASRLLDQLGIRRDREAVLGSGVELEDGKLMHWGHFHSIGRIVSGPEPRIGVHESPVQEPLAPNGVRIVRATSTRPVFRALSSSFDIALSTRRQRAASEFPRDVPLVQVDFVTRVPWILSAKRSPPTEIRT